MGWFLGGFFFNGSFLLLLLFLRGFVVLILFGCFRGFFKNVHLRKNLRYLRAETKPKVYQMTEI